MAYRAGAEISDIEFVQFHPTALAVEGAPRFLLSEALRGEGALLRNTRGERFMERYHELLELAPRDVVARAIVSEMTRTGTPHVFLDLTHRGESFIRERFPRIYETCLQYGVNIGTDAAPVAPAAHYAMGGVRTDLDGRTNVARLFAAGEAACTGVHGANRLASNSLLEGVVFGIRAGRAMREAKGTDLPVDATRERNAGTVVSVPGFRRRDPADCVGEMRDRALGGGAAGGPGAIGGAGAAVARGAQHSAGGATDRALRAGTRGKPRGALPHGLSGGSRRFRAALDHQQRLGRHAGVKIGSHT